MHFMTFTLQLHTKATKRMIYLEAIVFVKHSSMISHGDKRILRLFNFKHNAKIKIF